MVSALQRLSIVAVLLFAAPAFAVPVTYGITVGTITVQANRTFDNALIFELRVFISTVDHFTLSKDHIHTAVDQSFRKAGIVIAFPQVDMHVQSVPAPVSVPPGPKEQKKAKAAEDPKETLAQ